MKQSFETMLTLGSQAILEMAGVFSEPGPGRRAAGFSRTGQQVFVLEALANSDDRNAGEAFAHSYAAIIGPFGVFKKKEYDYLSYLSAASKAPKLIASLDKLYNERKGEEFAATILAAVKTGSKHALGAVGSVKIYNNWGVMSPPMKAIAIVMLGGQTYLVAPGKALCDLKIIDGPQQVFTVADALQMFSKGKNPYGLVENWNQIRNLTRIYNPNPTVEAVSDFADAHNLLSRSPNDSAVPGVTRANIQGINAKHAPQYGVGALATPKGTPLPQGYSRAADTNQGQLIVPTANAKSAAGALQGSLVGTKGGDSGISANALGVYKGWKEASKEATDKGVEGGSALLAGLLALKGSNSYLYGAMVAFLTHYAEGKILASDASEYAASLAGIALARLISGEKSYASDSEGAKIAKAVHSGSPADFAKLQTNLRALYASFRVSSRADAYQLSNQAYAEDRLNESDLVSMHEVFDIVYGENGLAAAQKLMNGKDRGLEIAKDRSKAPVNTMVDFKKGIHRKVLEEISKDEVRRRNQARYAKQQATNQPQVPQENSQAPTGDAPPSAGATPPAENQPQDLSQGANG